MSSGTFVTVEHYFNRYHFHDLADLNVAITEAEREREQAKAAINNVAFAAPDTLTPPDEEPFDYITRLLRQLWENYDNADFHYNALVTIREGWETKQED